MMMLSYYGVCQECGWVRFLAVYFPHKTNPNPRKIYMLWEKVALNATFNLFFLGLGWPWVGEFDGFIIMLMLLPTQQNLVNRKHRIGPFP